MGIRNPSLRVLVIEPSPVLFRQLLWNLRLNHVAHRCFLLNALLPGTPIPLNVGAYHVHPLRIISLNEALKEAQLSWDDIAFIKLDCEGCEWGLGENVELASRLADGHISLSAELHLPNSADPRYRAEWGAVTRFFCGPGSEVRRASSIESH